MGVTRYQAVRAALLELGPTATNEAVADYCKRHHNISFDDRHTVVLYISMVNSKMSRSSASRPVPPATSRPSRSLDASQGAAATLASTSNAMAGMAKYLVQIDAKNFLVEMEGKLAKHGFITFRYVEAADPVTAENEAVQMIRDDEELRSLVRNDPADPPVMAVLEIAELESFDGADIPPGRIWYEMSPKRWWQFWRR